MVKRRKHRHIKRWLKLSKEERALRVKSLDVLRLIREGKSLTRASGELGLKPDTVRHNLGSVLYKCKRKWRAKKSDTLERELIIYENGRRRTVIVKGSKQAAIIGRYYNDVKKGLYSGDWRALKKYKRTRIKNIYGKTHHLETDPTKIQEIELRREEHELGEIYD